MEISGTPSPTVVELRQLLTDATDDNDREVLLDKLAKALANSELDSAVEYLKAAAVLARQAGAARRLARHAIDAAELLGYSGRLDEAEKFLPMIVEAAGLAQNETDRQVILGQRDYVEATIVYTRGDFGLARELFRLADGHWEAAGLAEGRQAVQVMLGNIAILTGNLGEAMARERAAAEVAAGLGDWVSWANAMNNVALTLLRLGRWDDAVVALQQLVDSLPTEDRVCSAHACSSLADVLIYRDRIDEAVAVLNRGIELCSGVSLFEFDPIRQDIEASLGRALHRQGKLGEAKAVYWRVLNSNDKDPAMRALMLGQLAEVLADTGEIDEALECCRQSLELARNHDLRLVEAAGLRVEANLFVATGRRVEAEQDFARAVELLADIEDSYDRGLVLSDYARLLIELGQNSRAQGMLNEADRVFRRLGALRETVSVNRLLFQLQCSNDPDGAVLKTVAGLLSIGLTPEVLCREVLERVCSAYGFEQGAIVAGDRVFAKRGEPDLAPAAGLSEGAVAALEEGNCMVWPVTRAGVTVGAICLQRTTAAPAALYPLALGAVASLLGAVIGVAGSRQESTAPAGQARP